MRTVNLESNRDALGLPQKEWVHFYTFKQRTGVRIGSYKTQMALHNILIILIIITCKLKGESLY